MKHYDFGSSTAARTDECQQWRSQSEGVPKSESSFALDGTIIHGMLEERGLDDDYPWNHERTDLIPLAKEMWANTEALLQRHGAIEWEPEVTGTAADDVGGTLDLVINAGDKCVLLDYKTGMGVQVSPVNNKQILFAASMLLYGSAEASDLAEGKDKFVGVIMQPNRAGDVETREWEFTREQVQLFWSNHLANIILARDGDGELKAGDHCKFCPANGLCDATTGNLLRMQQLEPHDVENLKWALDMIEQVKETIKSVEALAYKQLEVGVEIPGWKLVRGRPGNTTWDDVEYAAKKLKRMLRGRKIDDVRATTLVEVKKIVTPTVAKKILKAAEVDAKFLDEITHRPEPKGMTLAPDTDKREAILSADAMQAALDSIK